MKIGKGDIAGQRRRRKDRYRGCGVCGDLGAKRCAGCLAISVVLDVEWPPSLTLVVDGAFVTRAGARDDEGPGHGGAGLVLVSAAGAVIATRSCSFTADNSSDAEFQAVIRGSRWVPGAVIYTDAESVCWKAISSNNALDVRFLAEDARGTIHALAHQLSVEGRLRQKARSGDIVAADLCS